MPRDVFPSTMRTWIGDAIERGPDGRRDVNAHIMETYAWPLCVYYLGTNSRWLGEPDDVVAGFFASRLGTDSFLLKWQASGLPLRRWLINGFCFFLMELKRERKTQGMDGLRADEPVTFTGDPEAAIDRAAVVAFVRKAMVTAQAACDEKGMGRHWRLFLRHHVDGVPFAALGREFEVDPARAAVMSRTAARRFRAALRYVLQRDGIAESAVDSEIRALVEVSA